MKFAATFCAGLLFGPILAWMAYCVWKWWKIAYGDWDNIP